MMEFEMKEYTHRVVDIDETFHLKVLRGTREYN